MLDNETTYKSQKDFLDKEGYLDNPNDTQAIEAGKLAYRRWYKNDHRKKNKKKKPEVVIILPNREALDFIKQKAQEHNRSMSALLWESTEAYLKQTYVQVHEKRWEDIQQSLMLTELAIRMVQELAEEDSQPMSYNFQILLEKVLEMKEHIEKTLNTPQLITEAIEELLVREPWQKDALLNTIKKY
jgi:hypothetical protein